MAQETLRLDRKTAKRIFSYLLPYWRWELFVLFSLVIGSFLSLAYPMFARVILDRVLIAKEAKLLPYILLAMIVTQLFGGALRFATGYIMTKISQNILMDIRREMYKKMEALSMNYHSSHRVGEIMSRILGDVGSLQWLATSPLQTLLIQGVTLIIVLFFMFYLSFKLSIMGIFTLPFLFFIFRIFNKRIRENARKVREKNAELSSFLQESISGIKEVKSFTAEEYKFQGFTKELLDLYRLGMRGTILDMSSGGSVSLIVGTALTAVFYFGSLEVITKGMTLGTLVAFNSYLFRLFGPIESLISLNFGFQSAMAAVQRIFEFLDTKVTIEEKTEAKILKELKGHITIKDLYFSYDGETPVLSDFNLEAYPGTIVALMGMSGTGKSTLVDLLTRLYDPQKGVILLDGVDLRDLKLSWLREKVGIVSQEVFLFNGTIKENIHFGNLKAREGEIQAAARVAYADLFIQRLPQGYDTMVGERGVRLSGGERQRIAIARAILKNPKILIFDEATSQLDTVSEHYLRESIRNLKENHTILIIAHRFSTIQDADLIAFLENGMIVACGSHEELLKSSPNYRDMYEKQLAFKNSVDRLES